MNSMLVSALLSPAESLLNGLLSQDPAAANRMQHLSRPDTEGLQPVVSVAGTSPFSWQIFLLPAGDRIQLRAHYEGPLSASVSASLSAYSKLLMSDNVRTALFDPEIELTGDTALIQGLFEVFRDLDVDWEHQVQKLLGGDVTQHLSTAFDSLGEWSQSATRSMRENVREFLLEEARLLPERSEVEAFYLDVDELRLHLDRLEARAQRLRGTLQPPPADDLLQP